MVIEFRNFTQDRGGCKTLYAETGGETGVSITLLRVLLSTNNGIIHRL
jgi:hypothetical protein